MERSEQIELIKSRREQMLNKPTEVDMVQRKVRLVELVEEYGFDFVAAATGLTVATIITYQRTKAPNISLNNLEIAEKILTEI